MLAHIARAPGSGTCAQHEAQLRIVLAGELVQLARPAHLVQHVGQLQRAVQGIGKGLGLGGKFGELDLVECTGAVGQLHARLEGVVALAGTHAFPVARGFVEAFDTERLAARPARGGLHLQCRLARDALLHLDGRDGIDQAIKRQLAFGRQWLVHRRRSCGLRRRWLLHPCTIGHRGHGLVRLRRSDGGLELRLVRHGIQQRIVQRGAQRLGGGRAHMGGQIRHVHTVQRRLEAGRIFGALAGLFVPVRTFGGVTAGVPCVVGHDQAEQDNAHDGQTDLQGAHEWVCFVFKPRPWTARTPCPRPRCGRHLAPAWSRRSAVAPFPWRSCCD